MIEVANLRKIYGQGQLAHHALKDVNLTVHPGEVLMLVGPSGSGKSGTEDRRRLHDVRVPHLGLARPAPPIVSTSDATSIPKIRRSLRHAAPTATLAAVSLALARSSTFRRSRCPYFK